MEKPRCSIIIPTYNHAQYIERSVQCALDQTYQNVEIIIVDDGSTDDTPEHVRKYADRVIYHRKANGGLGAARNTGIELSTGEYLQFLDADDMIAVTKIEKQIEIFLSQPDLAVVYSDCSCTHHDGTSGENTSYPLGKDENPLEVLVRQNILSVHAALGKREWVVKARGFDESRLAQEDWQLWLKIALLGGRYKYSPGEFAHYDQTGSEMTSNPVLMYRRMRHMLELFLDDPAFLALDQYLIDRFVASQNLQLATRAYNNRWWRASRKHFRAVKRAEPEMFSAAYRTCISKSYAHQALDTMLGQSVEAPSS